MRFIWKVSELLNPSQIVTNWVHNHRTSNNESKQHIQNEKELTSEHRDFPKKDSLKNGESSRLLRESSLPAELRASPVVAPSAEKAEAAKRKAKRFENKRKTSCKRKNVVSEAAEKGEAEFVKKYETA